MHSNTTLVKVKFYFTFCENLYIYYSNTTLVKVKFVWIMCFNPFPCIQIQHLLKLNGLEFARKSLSWYYSNTTLVKVK